MSGLRRDHGGAQLADDCNSLSYQCECGCDVPALRFLGVFLLTCTLVSLLGRWLSDFEGPSEIDPHDLIRGLAVYLVALLVAALNEMRIQRRKREAARDTGG